MVAILALSVAILSTAVAGYGIWDAHNEAEVSGKTFEQIRDTIRTAATDAHAETLTNISAIQSAAADAHKAASRSVAAINAAAADARRTAIKNVAAIDGAAADARIAAGTNASLLANTRDTIEAQSIVVRAQASSEASLLIKAERQEQLTSRQYRLAYQEFQKQQERDQVYPNISFVLENSDGQDFDVKKPAQLQLDQTGAGRLKIVVINNGDGTLRDAFEFVRVPIGATVQGLGAGGNPDLYTWQSPSIALPPGRHLVFDIVIKPFVGNPPMELLATIQGESTGIRLFNTVSHIFKILPISKLEPIATPTIPIPLGTHH